MKKIKLSKKKIIKIFSFVIVLALAVVLSYIPNNNSNKKNSVPTWDDIYVDVGLRYSVNEDKSPFSVHYIDVGQGDCTLIKSGDFSMLIDAGEQGNEQKILDYLKAQNINKLTYLIATHPHSDHIGGMEGVLKVIKVDNIFMPKLSIKNTPTTKQYEEFLQAVKKSGANIKLVEESIAFDCEDVKVEIISPDRQSENLNNMSVVTRLTYKNKSFLFMGDAEKEIENELLNKNILLQSDVLKIGHHGSSTSSIDDFIKAVKPSLGIISCGENNSFGHPNGETLDTLKNNNVKVKRTDKNGTIVIDYDGKQIKVSSEKGE